MTREATSGVATASAEEDDWTFLSLTDLEADLDASAEAAVPAGVSVLSPQSSDEDLRLLLKQHSSGAKGFDVDALFAGHRALHAIAADLQMVLLQVETLQFDSAALFASISYGPLRPPKTGEVQEPSLEDTTGARRDRCDDRLSTGALFGPEAAPAAPPRSELSFPVGAANLSEYRRLLVDLPLVLSAERVLRFCVGEIDVKQDTKDIGRDIVVVNGHKIVGSIGGYDAAVAALTGALQEATTEELLHSAEQPSRRHADSWSNEELGRASQLILAALNRTSSGFMAFEEVLRIFDCPDAVVVSPESAAAKPLEAVVLGDVVLGRAHTRYAVYRADAGGPGPLAAVDAFFVFRLSTSLLHKLVQPRSGPSERGNPTFLAEDIRASVLMRRA